MAPARVDSESDVPASSTTIVAHDVPVLIVGAGPAGLLQARLLSRLGGMNLASLVLHLAIITFGAQYAR